MEHLDQILAIGGGHSLPEGARVTSVTPAVKLAERNPRGWGYVIAFEATDSSIRRYVTDTTIFSGEIIERYSIAKAGEVDVSDINFDEISSPWKAGVGDMDIVLERPLGRGWLIISGSSR
ncbi:hypothetical protein E4J66_14070 [Actinomyces viscosus]|uniref:Uncharacterized protein n=2 Tax=Actinomyces viscosus TaxID=1656 RepID=A0A3S4VKY7_ACTVI|nr:hypothetical protein E4J66_14070 [Actinomyces viscosus]VEI17361.1 Uncharacterised protein [Actinomyces viscosus]